MAATEQIMFLFENLVILYNTLMIVKIFMNVRFYSRQIYNGSM